MIYYQVEKGGGGTMVPSVIDYLLQLPEAMHFARVQELCGDGVFFYRMLSEYGNGTFQLIEFEDDLLLILIGDYTPNFSTLQGITFSKTPACRNSTLCSSRYGIVRQRGIR